MSGQLTPAQDVLLWRIRQHLVELSASSQFTARLARENRWSSAFAEAVVDEYAKFLFIAREGGHPVSPSPMIDKAWHLHLLYTREYWSDFCPNILGFNLEHSPHTGNPSDSEKFDEWTIQTLNSYRKFFGTPNRIWRPLSYSTDQGFQAMAFFVGAAGIVVFAAVALLHLPGFLCLIAIILIVMGMAMFLKSYRPGPSAASNNPGTGCGTFSSCGSPDSASYTGDSGVGGLGGHGHGHGCGGGHGGGHGCGGSHGCGGGGCGGGGGH